MARCFSFSSSRNSCFKFSFSLAGLESSTKDLGDGTIMHFWIPKTHKDKKPNLLLIHGLGTNAMWQWDEFISPLSSKFNIYLPDLLFFGDSYTTRPERSEAFQAQCVMRTMEALGVKKMSVVGISYGGFVGYNLAVQFPEAVEKLVLGCAGVCLEEKDMEEGMFLVKSVEDAVSILLPQTPEKLRELMKISFHKPQKSVPSCFLNDFIHTMCAENRQERIELIQALYKGRKFADLPKITHPTLIIWGEHDQIFPLELGHRFKRHLGENAELLIIKNAGHAFNIEASKELCKHLKSFLVNPLTPSKKEINGSSHKKD
ncbi:unnamed protein product [Coffea canephora]|uniref:AB hydrolase-1 domain-containing protein n=2 Tax=Coffea TaxID=13442 RepID=A0A068TYX9_COFCA|nr:uncharacterized protein LOC113699293 [Coffea arabica]CDP01476.1 unnamed protein product [Coffea canephora]